jgi:signal peptidase I
MKIPSINIRFTDLSQRMRIYKKVNDDNSTCFFNGKVYLIKGLLLLKNDIIDLKNCDLKVSEDFYVKNENNFEILKKCIYVIDELKNSIYVENYEKFKKNHLECYGILASKKDDILNGKLENEEVRLKALNDYYDEITKDI